MRFLRPLASFLLLVPFILQAQVSYTANDSVAPANSRFQPGYNSGFAAGWSDLSIADMATGNPAVFARGSGLWSNRDALFYEALETEGIASKMDEVIHYTNIGQRDLVALTLGGEGGANPQPPQNVRDQTFYCPTKQSTLFRNLYTPIWDGGANGTPYNDTNYYARYMYRTVNQYKDYIQFWEIWNEPGFDFTGNRGWRAPGDTIGNWWDADPNPCDYKLHAPVQHYVRMLRISWEIVKTLDPTAHVCMGAPGFASFVDAVARNTDNPVDGSVTPEYPLRGGAYFDAMCYHAFPHIDGSFITDRAKASVLRNSDRGAFGVVQLKRDFDQVLAKYGYNGIQYPKKKYLITEINLPRRIFNYTPFTYGGQVPQRNFMMKALMECKIEKIMAAHVYTFGELRSEQAATDEFDLMGLYYNMDNTNYFTAFPTEAGIGVKTMSDLIYRTEHDPIRSAQLNNNPDVRIEAFKRSDGKYVYAIWAIMKQDFNELGVARYSFPASANIQQFLKKYYWSHSITSRTYITGNSDILVDGTPVFLVEDNLQGQPRASFSSNQNRFCITDTVRFQSVFVNTDSLRWEFDGGTPSSSTSPQPRVVYATPGFHTVRLIAYGANGDSTVNEQNYFIHARTAPTAAFWASPLGGNVFFLNGSFDADSVFWDFGDGNTSTDKFPAHTYTQNGNYLVSMTTFNPCGTTTFRDTVRIEYALEVAVTATPAVGCTPLTVQLQANAPLATNFKWITPGGQINNDTIPNPIVVYPQDGQFSVSLTVANGINSATVTKNNFIRVQKGDLSGSMATVSSINNLTVRFNMQAPGAQTYLWRFGDGNTSTLAFPQHTYAIKGTYTVTCTVANACDTFQQTLIVTVGGDAPLAAFSQSTTSACAPATVQFSNQTTGATSYLWSFQGGNPSTSTAVAPSVTFAQPGTYMIQLIATNQWGKDTAVSILTVKPRPDAVISAIQIDTFKLTASSASTNFTGQIWYFGDGSFSTQPNVTHTYPGVGTYQLLLIATNDCGTDTASSIVTITGNIPVASYVAIPNQGCAPLSVTYQDQSTPLPTFRQWSFPGGTPSMSSERNPIVVYSTAGVYGAQLIVGNVYGRDTVTVPAQITVSTSPTANFTFLTKADTVTFTYTGSGQQSVSWDFGDGSPKSSQLNPVHRYPSGTYTVRLTATNTCGVSTIERVITITSPLKDASDPTHTFRVTPNPVTQEVYLDGLEINQVYQVEFVDASGRLVLNQTITCGAERCGPVSVHKLHQGNYRVIVRNAESLKWAVMVKI